VAWTPELLCGSLGAGIHLRRGKPGNWPTKARNRADNATIQAFAPPNRLNSATGRSTGRQRADTERTRRHVCFNVSNMKLAQTSVWEEGT